MLGRPSTQEISHLMKSRCEQNKTHLETEGRAIRKMRGVQPAIGLFGLGFGRNALEPVLLQQTGQALRLRNRQLEHHLYFAIVEDTNIGRVRRREEALQGFALIQNGFAFRVLILLNLLLSFPPFLGH